MRPTPTVLASMVSVTVPIFFSSAASLTLAASSIQRSASELWWRSRARCFARAWWNGEGVTVGIGGSSALAARPLVRAVGGRLGLKQPQERLELDGQDLERHAGDRRLGDGGRGARL